MFKLAVRGAFKVEIEIAYDIHGDPEHLDNLNADELVAFLVERLGIPRRLVHIVGVLPDSVKLVIQFPLHCEEVKDVRQKVHELVTDACKEPVKEWIGKFKIFGIHIEQMEYVVFKKEKQGKINFIHDSYVKNKLTTIYRIFTIYRPNFS